jgi:hypothetical protein
MTLTRRELMLALAAGAGRAGIALASSDVAQGRGAEVIRSSGGVPAHVAGQFRDPFGFQQSPDGHYLVFDRRAHTVWRIAGDFNSAQAIVTIGQEQGKLYSPSAFAVGPNGYFVVADAPGRYERVQFFDDKGIRLSGFTLTGRVSPRVTLGTAVMNGIASLQFTGRTVLINRPEYDSLVSEYTVTGTPTRAFGTLRRTGHEADPDLHLAFNTGLPVVGPRGECFFVFVTGEPRFRKYDARGERVLERLIQGREIDEVTKAQPTSWPRRSIAGDELPMVPPTIRAAAVDPLGHLWVALAQPFLYVFDSEGEKVRTVRLDAAGPVFPNSLAFASASRLLVTPGLYEFRVR